VVKINIVVPPLYFDGFGFFSAPFFDPSEEDVAATEELADSMKIIQYPIN
jgi:hypothetical protein